MAFFAQNPQGKITSTGYLDERKCIRHAVLNNLPGDRSTDPDDATIALLWKSLQSAGWRTVWQEPM